MKVYLTQNKLEYCLHMEYGVALANCKENQGNYGIRMKQY